MEKLKAIIPAAGLGTRFLPLTKAQPKEMLPVVNKPTIQWVVEEAIDSGINDIAIITGKNKEAIANHFRPLEYLEDELNKANKFKELEEIRKISNLANIEFIVQEKPKGLGHAILCAKDFVGNSPFAVLLGDTICTGSPNCTKGLVDIFKKRGSSVYAVEKITPEETERYGVVSGIEVENGIMDVKKLVEKPPTEKAPSLLGILGRYVFTPDFFHYQNQISPGKFSEIQLTDAMQLMARNDSIYSWTFEGERYDIGTMKDWFQSHLELSSKSIFSPILKEVLSKL